MRGYRNKLTCSIKHHHHHQGSACRENYRNHSHYVKIYGPNPSHPSPSRWARYRRSCWYHWKYHASRCRILLDILVPWPPCRPGRGCSTPTRRHSCRYHRKYHVSRCRSLLDILVPWPPCRPGRGCSTQTRCSVQASIVAYLIKFLDCTVLVQLFSHFDLIVRRSNVMTTTMQLMEDFKMMNLFQAPSPTSTSDCTWYNVLYSTVSNDVHKLACAQAWEQSVAVPFESNHICTANARRN